MNRFFQVAVIALTFSGCADPLWHREGGLLNPWGGDFLGLASAWKRTQIRRIEQDWGANAPKEIWIYQP